MNIAELFDKNSSLLKSVQASIAQYLTTKSKLEIVPGTPLFVNEPVNIKSQIMIRLNQHNCKIPVIFGSSQPDFQKKFLELVAPEVTTPNFDTKDLDNQLLKAIYVAFDSDFKSRSLPLDSKPIICQIGKNLWNWGNVSAPSSIVLPFTSPKGPIKFEIPNITPQSEEERTLLFAGFPANSKVMIVEDSPTTRKMLIHLFGAAGFSDITECEDGLDAYGKFRMANPPYDLIIADWHMPKMSGFDLLKKIRSSREENLKDTPVILATGERKQEEVVNAIREKVSGYIVKPYEGDVLFASVKKVADGLLSKKLNII